MEYLLALRKLHAEIVFRLNYILIHHAFKRILGYRTFNTKMY